MSSPLDDALQVARNHWNRGSDAEAEHSYGRVAELARMAGNESALAHALRHLSDLMRRRGAREDARAHATEAVSLYRASDDRLGLANALRLQALSLESPEEAAPFWREARTLYASAGVSAGVQECNSHLAG